MLTGAVGVAMQQNLRLCLRQPMACSIRVDIGIGHATLFSVFALLAQALRDGLALAQWAGLKRLLPSGCSNLLAKLLVVMVVQAQSVAMAEQHGLLGRLKQARVWQRAQMGRLGKAFAG